MKDYKKGDECWSISEDGIKKHIVEDVKFLTDVQLIKLNNQWQLAENYYQTLNAAHEAEERHSFRMFR